MLKYIIVISFLICTQISKAQTDFLGYGFRAGMSFSKIDGPSELGTNGEELESNRLSSGFHIGMTINFKFSDIMGLRSELLYSQRGTKYSFEGPSYYVLGRNTLQSVNILGNRNQTTKVSNSYIDIPLTAYYKMGHFEVSGGFNTGLLVSSTAGGNVEFNGTSPNGNAMAPF